MQHTDQAHQQAQKNPETLAEANACSVQCPCSPVDFIGDVGSGRLGDSSWLKDVVKAERLMGVYEFFDWYQEFRKRLWAKRASYLKNHLESVEEEGLGKVEALIESYASKTKHGESLLHLLRKGEKTTLEVVTSIAIELWRKEFLREFISPPTSSLNPQALI